ncbi:cytochrome P450 [Streptomyces sp. NBC_01471]|uniref:cytochrome P450 n=1 Tax=Streptomyces sp. NBC_01471 TaxID=2903879 RepID=UPI0032504BF5
MHHPEGAVASARDATPPRATAEVAVDAARPFQLDDPLGWFDDAREHSPVLWHPQTASWYVTRFDDVWRLLLDARLGARSPEPFLRKLPGPQQDAVRPLVDFLSRWPMFLDAPRHDVVRRVLRPAFTPDEVTRVAEVVRKRGVFRAGSGADLLEAALRPACQDALSALLGVAPEDFPRLVTWSEKLMGFVGRSRIDATLIHHTHSALAQFTEFTGHALASGASPLARSVGAAVRDRVLQTADAVAIYAQLVTGALEPTVSALATALQALCLGPARRDHYAAEPAGFVHEAIRMATPFHFAARRAQRDMEIHGQRIPAGDRVVLVLAAANRDPRRFAAPLEFRRGRTGAHVAFGRGRHACMGALVTKHIMRTVLDAYLAETIEIRPVVIDWHITMGMKWPLSVTGGTTK